MKKKASRFIKFQVSLAVTLAGPDQMILHTLHGPQDRCSPPYPRIQLLIVFCVAWFTYLSNHSNIPNFLFGEGEQRWNDTCL